MPSLEVHTVGGGYYLYDVFGYLASFANSGNFSAILTMAITAGVLVGALQLAVFGAVRQVFTYFIGAMLVSALLVGPRAQVVVIDSTTPLGIYGVVDNVPWSVAWVASITSRASSSLTSTMETLLSPPDDLAYQRTGMLFGTTLLSQTARWRSLTPLVHEGTVNFLENCIVDGANLNILEVQELGYNGNLSSYIDGAVPQSLAFFDPVVGATITCTDGWPEIRARLTTEAQQVLSHKASVRFADNPTFNRLSSRAYVANTLDSFTTFLEAETGSAVDTIRQAMMVNGLDDAVQQLIARAGNDAAMTSYQAARTEAQTAASYSAVGISALKWVPLLKIVFHTLYIAAFPLAAIMMMTPLVWTVLKGYFGGFLWLAAWDPLSAILHSILVSASLGYYRDAMGTLNGADIEYVMTFANFLGIRAVEQEVGTVAGYLMMSVPFIATVLLFGAGRVAGLATSLLNVSQGAAIESGREAATGNLSLSNGAFNNFNANKHNTSSVVDRGRASSVLPGGSMLTINPDGTRTQSKGTSQSESGFSARVGQTLREEVSDRQDEAVRTAQTARSEYSTTVSDLASNYADFGRSLSNGTSVSRDSGTSENNRQVKEAREAHSAVQDFAKEHGISLEAAYAVAIGVGTGSAVPGLHADGSIRGTGLDSDRFSQLQRAATESGLSETVSRYAEATKSIRASRTGSETNTESEGDRWSLETAHRSAQSYADATERAQTLSRQEAQLYSLGVSQDTALVDAISNEWRKQGYGEEQIEGLLNPKTVQGVQAQERAVEEVLPNVLYELGVAGPAQDFSSATRIKSPAEAQAERGVTSRQLPGSGTEHRQEVDRVEAANGELGDAIGERRDALGEQAAGKSAATTEDVERGQNQGIVGGAVRKVASTAIDVADSVQEGAALLSDKISGQQHLTNYDRDVMIRTIHGEAGRESNLGQAAVAHTILNRVEDPRWGDNPAEVALQLEQFSAWNSGTGGNSLPTDLQEGSAQYERIGQIVDQVWAGQIQDPTGGATHYYSPAGMAAHVQRGEQSNELPRWLQDQQGQRGSSDAVIGGHVFTGRRRQ